MLFVAVFLFATTSTVLSQNCTFAGYDLRSLGGQTIQVPDRDQPNTYQYYVALCGNIGSQCDDITAGQKETGNVYQMGSPQTQVLCWCVSSKWIRSDIQASKNVNGLSLVSRTGDICKGAPRKTTINLICDPAASSPSGEGYQDPSNACHFIIDLKTKAACGGTPPSPTPAPHPTPPPPGKCGFNGYDLTKLAGKTMVVTDRDRPGVYEYQVSLCGNLAKKCDDVTSGKVESGNVYQTGVGASSATCWAVSSRWDSTIVPTKTSQGLALISENGDSCKSAPRQTVVNLICKPGSAVVTGYGYQDPNNSCRIVVELFTSVMCQPMIESL